jgi:hypothetical protein
MITLKDCVGLCGLTEEEVLAIAEHDIFPKSLQLRSVSISCHSSMEAKKFEI